MEWTLDEMRRTKFYRDFYKNYFRVKKKKINLHEEKVLMFNENSWVHTEPETGTEIVLEIPKIIYTMDSKTGSFRRFFDSNYKPGDGNE